jgi:hypothetical protein
MILIRQSLHSLHRCSAVVADVPAPSVQSVPVLAFFALMLSASESSHMPLLCHFMLLLTLYFRLLVLVFFWVATRGWRMLWPYHGFHSIPAPDVLASTSFG